MPFHKKFFRTVSKVAKFVPGIGGTVSTVAGFIGGQPRTTAVTLTPRRTVSRTQTARVSPFSQREKEIGRRLKFALEDIQPSRALGLGFGPGGNGEFLGGDPECFIPGQKVDPATGKCGFFFGTGKGPEGGFPLGDPVLGKYGAGRVPGNISIERAVCGKKMQLGDDGVCYNKSQISNKQRMWPAGRKPLLTGGDMRAISTAARAGKRMDLATTRLRKLGMMKKAATSSGPTPAQIEKIRHAALLEAHAGSKH